ncbi:MAG: deoxyribonuclease IV [Mycoplasma sp.]|nr:deoxyribonuclease IV [Mycoplasma sp.]
MIKLGSHVTFSKSNKEGEYLIGAGEFSKRIGANTMMIYLGSPRTAKRQPSSKFKIKEFKKNYFNVVLPEDIVVHEPYIINPSSILNFKFAEDVLIQDSKLMNDIGAKIMVIHPGAHTKFSRKESIEVLIQTMKNVIKKTKDTLFCLETMAGKGTEIGNTLKELSYIINEINSDRINICLDTCHMWDAGYDLSNSDELIKELKKFKLLSKVKVLHINDSKNPLGAAKDRHENIGKGFIGLKNLKKIVSLKEFDNIPMILETPYIDGKDIYKDEIKKLL